MESRANEQQISSQMREGFEAYAERMKEIRSLATPTLNEIRIPDDYSHVLKINFQHIGEMAAENRKIIADYIQPVLKSEEPLSSATRNEIERLNELLVNDKNIGEIDIHLSQMLVSRLFQDEINSGERLDENGRIILLSKMLRRDYYLITELSRSKYSKSAVQVIRGKAVEILRELDSYVAHEPFLTLSEEARSAVLLSSVFGILLYIDFLEPHPDSYYSEMLGQLELAERVFEDSFYRENMPNYDWESYEFRICYYGSFLANSRLNRKTARTIYRSSDCQKVSLQSGQKYSYWCLLQNTKKLSSLSLPVLVACSCRHLDITWTLRLPPPPATLSSSSVFSAFFSMSSITLSSFFASYVSAFIC